MRRSAKDVAEGQPLTIAAVEAAAERSAAARDAPHDRCYHNFAVLSALGDDALLGYLVARANKIAESIEPGAEEVLGDAF